MHSIIIEIPVHSNLKYEYDHHTNMIHLDRVLHTSMTYPGNYGFFPNTLAGDGDPLDALLITNYPIYPGTSVNVRIIGALLTEDEKGQDEKVLVVPIDSIDKHFSHIQNYSDLDQIYLDKIEHFFKHYKHLEKDKWVKVSGYIDHVKATEIYQDSYNTFLNKNIANPNAVSINNTQSMA